MQVVQVWEQYLAYSEKEMRCQWLIFPGASWSRGTLLVDGARMFGGGRGVIPGGAGGAVAPQLLANNTFSGFSHTTDRTEVVLMGSFMSVIYVTEHRKREHLGQFIIL